jgi:hypothetical protein
MTQVQTQCPQCGAPARGADWCTLCYADLRPPPPPPPVADEAGSPVAPASPRGKHARRAATDEEAVAPSLTGVNKDGLSVDAMFAILKSESTAPLGALAGRFDNKGAQLTLMVGGLVAIAAVLLVLMFLAGLLV